MLKTQANEENVDTLLAKSIIPIIDLAHCGTEECPVKSVVVRVGHQLQKSLSEKGMVLLVNHGISDEKLKTAWGQLDSFVGLPNDVKEHYIRVGENNHGYISPGVERFGKTPELRHAFNICTLSGQSLPEDPLPGFSDHISSLAKDFKLLASFILQALAISLEIPQTFFLENHSQMLSGDHNNETTLRLLYYPPVITDEENRRNDVVRGHCKYSYQRCVSNQPDFSPEYNPKEESFDSELKNINSNSDYLERKLPNGEIIRCGAHTDYGTFTLLAQDSEGGLEVKLPGSNKWRRLGHLPGAILLNCGEILSIWTNKQYPALEHRVVIPEQEHLRCRGRHSIAFFCHPDNLTLISPNELPESINQSTTTSKQRKKSFKIAKERVLNAYQLIQRRFKDSYNNQ